LPFLAEVATWNPAGNIVLACGRGARQPERKAGADSAAAVRRHGAWAWLAASARGGAADQVLIEGGGHHVENLHHRDLRQVLPESAARDRRRAHTGVSKQRPAQAKGAGEGGVMAGGAQSNPGHFSRPT
jgi:hypothetical protein